MILIQSKVQTCGKFIPSIANNRIENKIGIITVLLDIVIIQTIIRLLIMRVKSILKTNTLIWQIFENITQFSGNIQAFRIDF